MKKIIILDGFIAALFSAIGYGYGYRIPSKLGCGLILSIIICLIVGEIVGDATRKIVFSSYIQKKVSRRILMGFLAIIMFFIFNFLSQKIFEETLYADYEEEIMWEFGIPIVMSIITFIRTVLAELKIKDKYAGKETQYFLKNKDIFYDECFYKKNKEITGEYDESLKVVTKTGIYVGKNYENVNFYLGIPYAKPPVKDLRWKPPVKLDNNNKVYEAYSFGASAIQNEIKGNFVLHYTYSEDCLYLNVFLNKTFTKKNKPVIVVFHGGDFTYGGSVNPLYYGINYVNDNPNCIYVSFNYRLGVLGNVGFKNFDDNDDYKNSTNLNLLDQIMALNWIKENISSFGGDANNITVFGNGSGAVSISALAVSELAKGLFNRAILVAGSPLDIWFNDDRCNELGNLLKENFKVNSIKELLNISESELIDFNNKYFTKLASPICDGKIVPKNIYKAYKDGVANGIDFIVGIPDDEYDVFKSTYGNKKTLVFANEMYKYLNNVLTVTQQEKFEKIINDIEKNYIDIKSKDEALHFFFNLIGSTFFCKCASNANSKVYCLYWYPTKVIEKLGAGSLSIVSTILGNSEIAEEYGIIVNKDIKEVMQLFINKFINNEKLEIGTNEIEGIDKLNWLLYKENNTNYMCVKNNIISILNDFVINNIEECEDFIQKLVEK